MSVRSTHRARPLATEGRTTIVSAIAAAAIAYAMPSTSPARMISVRPTNASRPTRAAGRLGRGFGVIVLVLVSVVARIVVLVSREVDLVEDDGREPRRGGHDRLERALGEPAARHFGADDEGDPVDERRENHRVGHRQHGWRVEHNPVEGPVRK